MCRQASDPSQRWGQQLDVHGAPGGRGMFPACAANTSETSTWWASRRRCSPTVFSAFENGFGPDPFFSCQCSQTPRLNTRPKGRIVVVLIQCELHVSRRTRWLKDDEPAQTARRRVRGTTRRRLGRRNQPLSQQRKRVVAPIRCGKVRTGEVDTNRHPDGNSPSFPIDQKACPSSPLPEKRT